MTFLDPFLGVDAVELRSTLRALIRDPMVARPVTYQSAGEIGTNWKGGTTTPGGAARTIRAIGGSTQDRHTGEWSVGTRTYLALREDFIVPKPSTIPARGDYITETDGSRWTVTDADHGDFGDLFYYVLRTRQV